MSEPLKATIAINSTDIKARSRRVSAVWFCAGRVQRKKRRKKNGKNIRWGNGMLKTKLWTKYCQNTATDTRAKTCQRKRARSEKTSAKAKKPTVAGKKLA